MTNIIALHGKEIDAACDNDRQWFIDHPGRQFRLRRPMPFEFEGPFAVTIEPQTYVLVVSLANGDRMRVKCEANDQHHAGIKSGRLHLDAAPEQMLREAFQRTANPEARALLTQFTMESAT